MIIGIQSGLNSLKDGLEQRGYKVQIMESNINNNHVDIFIYNSGHMEGVLTDGIGAFTSSKQEYNLGTLMVNAKGKSLKDIEYIINNRCYTSLELY